MFCFQVNLYIAKTINVHNPTNWNETITINVSYLVFKEPQHSSEIPLYVYIDLAAVIINSKYIYVAFYFKILSNAEMSITESQDLVTESCDSVT